ncbi:MULTISPECIES: FGGY-family carbohydrate kinase [unclassified Oceanobacillus]|uniref:FGGY-family carbohydrate kinase n=1 Tax=unclassified Oceanobacillus TaxID=2630292 RepID=UPI00300E6C33
MKKQLLMGIDAGTESVRVGLYDLQGKEVGIGVTEYQTFQPKPGWAEQNPREWWSALVTSTKKALSQSEASKEEVIGISLDTTSCSVVLCKNDGTPLRSSLIWMDVRASEEAKFIAATNNKSLKYNGFSNVSPEWMPCKALWLKRNDTENYDKADKVVDFTDWYTYMLTGRWTGNLCNATFKAYYDLDEGGWPIDFYKEIGLSDLIGKFPDNILKLGERVGGLSRKAANELELCEGTPVGQGGIDSIIGLIGLGVVKPGRLALITGSSHLLFGLTEKKFHAKGIFGAYPHGLVPNLNVIEGSQISTGSILKWFKTQFCKDLEEEAANKDVSVYDLLTLDAEKIPPGSEGLLVMDYWQGNRTPFIDPNLRGMIYGLSLMHRREHLFKAIMEGISYGTDHIIQTFKENGFSVTEVYAAGGATKSKLFLQIHADVSNITINVPENSEAPLLGSAILGGVAAGAFQDIEDGIEQMVRIKDIIKPNKENHEKYKEIAQQYRKVYPQFGNWMRETTKVSQ